MIFFTLAILWAQSTGGGAAVPSNFVLQSGHGANISALAFSPDGKFLVSASEDATLKIWDPATGTELRTLRGHTNIVTSLALSRDGTRIASASLDHTLRVWNAATGEILSVFKGTQPTAYLLKFTPDGNSLITVETVPTGSILRIWDIKTGKLVRAIKRNDAAISHIFFTAQNTMLVSEESGEDDATGALTTYDLLTGRLLQTRQELLCGVSDNGKWMAVDRSTQKAREALIVDLQKDKPFAKLSGQVSRVVFSSTGDWLAYESAAGDTAVVRQTSGGTAHSIHGHGAEFSMLALSPDGRWLATAGGDYSVHIWDVETGKLAHGMAGQYTPSALVFTPDNRQIVVNGGASDLASALQVWDIERRAQVTPPHVKHSVNGLASSKDGALLAASGGDVEVFDARSNGLVAKLNCAAGSAASPVFSPSGKWVAASCGGVTTAWAIASGREVLHFGEVSDYNTGPVLFSPDGRYLAASSTNGLLLYDTIAGKLAQSFNISSQVAALNFSAGGEWLAVGTRIKAPLPDQKQSTLVLLDMRTRRKVWTAVAGQWVSAIKFSNDGHSLLAATGEDLHRAGNVVLFDQASGKAIRRLPVRVPSTVSPAFSPNGEWLAFGWDFGTSLWRLNR